MSDEEFARRLQEEEERQMAARLMAMAGVGARQLVSGMLHHRTHHILPEL